MACMRTDGDTWREAYGRVLGTVMIASLLELGLSFVPPRTLRRLFPPIVTGTAVFLIGASLVGTGVKCAPSLLPSWTRQSQSCSGSAQRQPSWGMAASRLRAVPPSSPAASTSATTDRDWGAVAALVACMAH